MAAGPTYEPIATQTLSSAQASVVFSAISQAFTDLVLVGNNKNTANNFDEVGIQFNGDTSSNYSRTRFFGDGSSPSSGGSNNTNKGAIQINSTTEFGPVIANIQNYSNSTTYKTVLSRGNAVGYVSIYVSTWRNTNAITEITLLPDTGVNFSSGTIFTLYGITAA